MEPITPPSNASIPLPENPDDIWSVSFRELAGDLLTRPIVLSKAYLKGSERVMNHPKNREGADKTWVWNAEHAYRDHFARAIRVS